MAHHEEHHPTGNKPVSFTAPLILGLVAVFVILLFVSLGDPCHGCCCSKEECSKECAEACEKGGHPEGMTHEKPAGHHDSKAATENEAKPSEVTPDTTKATPSEAAHH